MTRLTVTHLAARGDGVAPRPGQPPLYVPDAAPGDVVLLDAAGHVVAVEPGDNRAAPACGHYGACGGCALQHVSAPVYAQWCADRIRLALAQHGVPVGHMEPAHVSPPASRRRASLRAVKKGGQIKLGFNAERSHALIDLNECAVLHPRLFDAVKAVRAFLPARMREGQAVGVQLTLSETGVDLLLTNLSADKLPELEALADLAERLDLARLSVEGALGLEVVTERRPPLLTFDGAPVRLPPASFTQATTDGEAALIAAVQAAADGVGPVVDLFAGIGTFSLPLSRRASVTAVDAAKPALLALERAARQAGRPVAIEHRDLYRRPLQPSELKRFAMVVCDPPRAGAEAQARAVAGSAVPLVVGVSCNPNSFARDAALLAASGFRLTRLWPIGQFLWSTHVELVARFER